MKIDRAKWAAGVAAVVIAGVAAGAAASGAGWGGRREAGAFRSALGKVGLSAEQRERIRAIMSAQRPSLEALRGKRQMSKAELDAALQAPNPDPTTVGSALLTRRADRQALRAEMRKVREQTVSVLTPEQRATLDGYLAGARATRRGGRS